MIVEFDMPKDEYFRIKDERAGRSALRRHVENKETCEVIQELAERMIFNYKGVDDPTYEEVVEMINKMRFRHKV
jgi:hypothetical protein